ncbi:MAG TPA: inorganic diphosphatase [Verrucomicrobiae bacterium]|nr:inorganic diphosphatase [Verrucomicrobiae bacterium]
MKTNMEQLETFDTARNVNVIIETPKGSHFKYVYTPESGLFRIKRVLPPGMVFPFNFGFIPSTRGEDGDPLDVMIINDEPMAVGCLLKARLLGVVHAEQTENGKTVRNDRLLGALMDEESPAKYLFVEFDERKLAQVEFFFATYNRVSGKEFKVLGFGVAGKAEQLVEQGKSKFGKK